MTPNDQSRPSAVAITDAELVRAAQRGEKRAFVEIVARYQGLVCGIALSILGDFAASEDAGQEAFLTAWRRIHDLRDPERLRAWLSTIARNAARGQLRAQKRFEALDEDLEIADTAPAPDEAIASEDEAALVRLSLARLPETYRVPLILYYREGQSVRAVADALGISEDAAKQRLARGRELCREKISNTMETVLARTRPSTIFTMAIAVAIGALAAPSAMAAAAFAAGATAGTSITTYSIKTALSAVMTTSKAFLLAAATVALICVPIGYQIHSSQVSPRVLQAPLPLLASNQVARDAKPSFADSALVAQWRALHQTYGANAAAMPALYDAIKKIKDSFQRQALRSALIAEWSEVDPAGGLAFFLANGHDQSERLDFFREWLARDPQAAVKDLMASSGWQSVAHDCLSDIAHADPNSVAAIVAQLPKPDNSWDTTIRDAFAIVAQGNLDTARKAAQALTGPNRDQALAGVASVWAQTDLDAAIAWAKTLPHGVDKDEIIRSALVGKAGVDPVAALDSVGVVPEGGRQSYFASSTGARVLSAAAGADFDATVSWLVQHPGRLNGDDLTGLAGSVTDRLNADPAGFLSTEAGNGALGLLMPAIGSAFLNGSQGQRGAVWNWIQTQPPSADLTSLETQVVNSAGWQDPMAALQMAADLPNTPDGAKLTQSLANSLLNGGQMLYRFNELYANAPASLQAPLAEGAFNVLRSDNLGDPQAWIANLQYLPSANYAQGVQSLAKAWGGQDPGAAIAWVDSLPSGDQQNSALAALASGWASRDATGAANWILSMAPGEERDQSTVALVSAVAGQSPADAWNWALSIGDTTERDNAANSVIQAIASKDPNDARQWIDAGPFNAAEKAKLVAILPTPTH